MAENNAYWRDGAIARAITLLQLQREAHLEQSIRLVEDRQSDM